MPAPLLATTAAPNRWLSTATAGGTLTGSSAYRDQLAANSVNITLVGDGLDDTYIAYDASTKVVEQAGGGIDTVVTWGNSYTLSANVENLTLKGSANASATGNSGNNLIIGNDGDNRIVTGGGNDVLVGSKGADTYIPTKAADSITWITGFKTAGEKLDKIDLRGFGIDGFAGIQSRMTQIGTDVRIDLGNGQQVMLENKTKSELTATHFQVEASTANIIGLGNLIPTFADEFDSLRLYSTWQPHDGWGNRTLKSNGELQLNVDPLFNGLGINPFSVANGALTITAAKSDPSLISQLAGYQYTSGMLSSHASFSQQYGYFEIRAQMTDQQGMWPAFWMLPTNGTWPPELDVVEMVGKHPYSVVQTTHTKDGSGVSTITTSPTNLANGFHTYGMNWTASKITFYFDGQVTKELATPADMHTPMYMMVNLAVGGAWPGSPDATTDWSKTNIKVDYIRAYKHGTVSALEPTAPTSPEAPSLPGLTGVISHAMNSFDLRDSFTTQATGANTATTYSASQLQIAGVATSVSVHAAYDSDNVLSLTNKGAWGGVRNARVESSSHGSLTIDNFVDAQISLGDGASTVKVISAKRGSITTGAGNDTISVAAFSNDGYYNVMKINAGGGNDTISFSGAANTKTAIVAGSGDDAITIAGKAGGTINAGDGNDRIVVESSGVVTAAGGQGQDVFEFIRSAHATISDFNASEDRIVIRGGSDSTVQLRASNGSTIVDLGGGASITLTGVATPSDGIAIAYA